MFQRVGEWAVCECMRMTACLGLFIHIFFPPRFLCVYECVHEAVRVKSCSAQAYDSLADSVQSAMQSARNRKHWERQVRQQVDTGCELRSQTIW